MKLIYILGLFLLSLTFFSCAGVSFIPSDTLGNGYISKVVKEYKNIDIQGIESKGKEEIGRDYLLIINYNYENYEGSIIAGKGERGFAFDMSSLLLSTASALLGAESTKTMLSTASSLVQSTQTGIDKNFFAEQSIDIIVARMRALRAEALIPIEAGLEDSNYSKRELMIDLLTYYRAGTVSSAVQDIIEQSTEESKSREEEAIKAMQ